MNYVKMWLAQNKKLVLAIVVSVCAVVAVVSIRRGAIPWIKV